MEIIKENQVEISEIKASTNQIETTMNSIIRRHYQQKKDYRDEGYH
jgi:hypothetical protein